MRLLLNSIGFSYSHKPCQEAPSRRDGQESEWLRWTGGTVAHNLRATGGASRRRGGPGVWPRASRTVRSVDVWASRMRWTSSRSRKASNPASDVTLEPWNSSFRRRSKSTRRPAPSDSPAAHPIFGPPNRAYRVDSYMRIVAIRHKKPRPPGNCGLIPLQVGLTPLQATKPHFRCRLRAVVSSPAALRPLRSDKPTFRV